MNAAFSLPEIESLLSPRSSRGHTAATLTGIAALKDAAPGDISFLGNPKYKTDVAASRASVILVPVDYDAEPSADQCLLLVDNPSAALAKLCARIEQLLWPRPAAGIHPSAIIDPSAKIAADATVGPLCVIEAGVVIGARTHVQAHAFLGRDVVVGEDCWLLPGVKIYNECVLRDRVRLHAGVVIGSDGFGYEFNAGRHEKVPQVGRVVIESDVEIGANTTIDRARFSQTLIGEGTKIDNLVQIGHNVVVGKHCLLCAQVGISGSTTLGDYVVLGGQAGVAGHLHLGKGTKAGGQSGIGADTTPGSYVNGSPALPYMLERRITVLRERIPGLFRQVDTLQRELEDLKKSSAP
ncbi:MAG: UDP-3-O-(3-hydroxymyristoyl)glucosamine N-acyltransferase [Verrucomicrobiota bacterium]